MADSESVSAPVIQVDVKMCKLYPYYDIFISNTAASLGCVDLDRMANNLLGLVGGQRTANLEDGSCHKLIFFFFFE